MIVIEDFTKSVLNLPRYAKQLIVLISDVSLCVIAVWLAFYLRLDKFVALEGNIAWAVVIALFISVPIFALLGLYRTIFRYSGKSVFLSVALAILIYALLYISIITIYGINEVPRSIGFLQPLVLFFLISGSRLLARYILGDLNQGKKINSTLPRALIYGAGSAGRQLVSALESSNQMFAVGFLDDDELLHGQILYGKKIYKSENLDILIKTKQVTHVLLALPSISRNKRMSIIKKLGKYKIVVRTLPSVTELVEGKVTTSDIRELEIEDILERVPIDPNIQLLRKNIDSKVVMVTGAGGSIGSELSRQILKLNPLELILVEISEYSLYRINSELEEIKSKISNKTKIVSLLASVQDKKRIEIILKTYKPHTLYHTAAYKHVPVVEENVCEGIKNNIFGTLVTAKAAIEAKVLNFVLVSSDKAVRPTNIMGATKRVSEICLQALFYNDHDIKTKIGIVRFGNVLDSSGSVIPKFKKQIKDGGPVTLTHPDVTRYFMTIPEAAQLIIQAGAMAEKADIFALDMGEPIKIKDLIEKIVTLSGLSINDENNPDGDIEIKVIGLRHGEKLYEELFYGNNPKSTLHPKIKKAQDSFIMWNELEKSLEKLKEFTKQSNIDEIMVILAKLVKEYKWNGKIVDKIAINSKMRSVQALKDLDNKEIFEKVINLKNKI